MRYLISLFTLIFLSGCASLATFFAVNGACAGTGSQCDNAGVAVDAAVIAFEVDKAIYAEIKNRLLVDLDSPRRNYLAAEGEHCEDGFDWVCYAGQGCLCEAGDKISVKAELSE